MSTKIQKKISKQVRVEGEIHRKLKKKSYDTGETITRLVTRLLKPHLTEYEMVIPKSN